jgi:hypothetical protein
MVAKAKSSVEGQRVAVGYVRVSTEVQAREGQSLEAQEERLKQWAAVNGYAMLTVYRDEGLSGKRADNRPGLQAALSAVCANRGVLVTYSLSRLARSTRDAILIAERLENQRQRARHFQDTGCHGGAGTGADFGADQACPLPSESQGAALCGRSALRVRPGG